ncbi:unnamed protein product [Prorocentrum cordatum]|uniref:RING-type domain-containing protein n=1 Tax=Prorocentrum cordatum TaxID=2364126 RepID=A0ABN9UJU9_9DINO|nr:unnamed protein product [Polarella glacialis]
MRCSDSKKRARCCIIWIVTRAAVSDELSDVGRSRLPSPPLDAMEQWLRGSGVHLLEPDPELLRLGGVTAVLGVACGVGFVVAYIGRLAATAWLRQEWADFLRQLVTTGTLEACSICAEEVPLTAWHTATMPCCGGRLCWSCVRRHAESVIDDARPEMLCPLCHDIMPDRTVLTAIRREQWSLWGSDLTGDRARRKARTYKRWVISCGVAATCSARSEDVVRCPGDGCNHMHVLPREMRQQKSAHEPRSPWNPRGWAVGRRAGLYAPATDSGRDIRRVHCEACELDSCLVCGLPWEAPGDDAGCHDGKSCREHRGRFAIPGRNADAGGAKACPTCGVNIIRSAGCNHMTCTQCHSEWCWVCLSPWTPRHYACAWELGWAEGDDPQDVC